MTRNRKRPARNKKLDAILGIATVLVFCFVCVAIWATSGSDGGKSDEPEGIEAYVMCQQFIEERLKAPGSAKYPVFSEIQMVQDGNAFTIFSYVDAQNSFGALIRSDYECAVEYIGDDRWNLNNLEIYER